MGNTPSEPETNTKKRPISRKGSHECPKCSRCYEKKYDLRKHKEVCGIPPHLKCELCQYKCSYKRTIKYHLKTFHMDELQTLARLELMLMEIMKKGKKERLNLIDKLEDGTQEFVTKNHYITERVNQYCQNCKISYEHPTLKNFCPMCDKPFVYECKGCHKIDKTMSSIRSHVLYKCFPKSMYSCDDCEFKTAKKSTLRDHIMNKHTLIQDFHTCSKCGTKIKHRNNFRRHERHCGDDAHYYQCEICGRRIKYKVHFDRHMHRHKLKEEVCEFIRFEKDVKNDGDGNKYYVKIDKEDKMSVDENKNHMNYSEIHQYLEAYCQSCNERVKWKHRITRCKVCTKKLLFRCGDENCQKEFDKQSDLYHHVYNMHATVDLSQVQCSKCLKTFINAAQLQIHQRHTCEKEPHLQCNYCPYKSKRKFNLTSHINRKHADKTQIQCELCGKIYKTLTTFSSHLSYCEKTPDIQCVLCDYRTKVKYNMLEHVRSKHVELYTDKILRCERCFVEIKNIYLFEEHVKMCCIDDDLLDFDYPLMFESC